MPCIEITNADFDDMHHALGRPDLIERLTTLSNLEPGWYANVGARTGEACCAAMREAAAALASKDEEIARTKALLDGLVEAMAPFMPVMLRETPDYCELTLGEHQTQAMTVAPDDWATLSLAYTAASRQALQGGADVSR